MEGVSRLSGEGMLSRHLDVDGRPDDSMLERGGGEEDFA
jgi:hypothetical protein